MRMAVPGDSANRQALLMATREGGVGLIASVWDDAMARRLASLQVRRCVRWLAAPARPGPWLCAAQRLLDAPAQTIEQTHAPARPQDELAYFLPHTAGLNPKAFRARYAKTPRALAGGFTHTRPLPPGGNALLQGDLLWAYVGLDLKSQARLAAALGLARHDVLADLKALAAATGFL